jgi:hypothetical protein
MSPDGTTESFTSVTHDEFENQIKEGKNGLNYWGSYPTYELSIAKPKLPIKKRSFDPSTPCSRKIHTSRKEIKSPERAFLCSILESFIENHLHNLNFGVIFLFSTFQKQPIPMNENDAVPAVFPKQNKHWKSRDSPM